MTDSAKPHIKEPMVLLVEDSQDDAFFFEWAVEKAGLGIDLQHVWHGGEAMDLLNEAVSRGSDRLPVLTFLDLKMPIVNGFDLLNWLREQPFAHQVPVVVLSGSDQVQDRELSLKLGARDYLVKPVREAVLRRLLVPLLTHSETVSSGD